MCTGPRISRPWRHGPWHFHSPCAFPAAQPLLGCINRVLGVYGYSGFRRESKITREVDRKRASRVFGVHKGDRLSESQLECYLAHAGISDGPDEAEIRRADTLVRVVRIYVVEGIEKLAAKLELAALVQRKVLG